MHRRRSNRTWPPMELPESVTLEEAAIWLEQSADGAATVIADRGYPCGIVELRDVRKRLR
ncbi:CBS domain-containing protein [Paracoccus laeviglucosivorans]|nr:CBS domain-containing protein [Paracoccus laeviglucosivorans]